MGASFTHLHQHTEFSMLDGAARVPDVIARAAADGQPAIGITDHGNMYGVLDFYRAAREAGIKPIIGTEAYMAAESRFERPVRRGRLDDGGGDAEAGEKLYYHLTLLAETNVGYKNLLKLSSEAYLEGYYMKPRCDWELLERHHEGIIASTGCLGGVVLQALLRDDFEKATRLASRLQDIFGRESLFVELQDHGLDDQRRTNPDLIRLAQRIKAPLLATNDSHYVSRGDAEAHDALLCVQTGSVKDDPKRFKFHGDEHYLKTADEMRQLFRDYPEACDNTLWIAERADVTIEFGKPKLPSFPRPVGFDDADSFLRHLAYEGAAFRYGDPLPVDVVQRLEFELGVISDMGFSDYFLVVWDLIKHARDNNIRVGPGRGSAAGCCVAYCLRIVDLDPIRYNLLFERFLNPGRKQMPDIDMDFDERYRSEMIRYAAERYGWDRVAQIVTFSTIKARAAVRDAARVLGHPYGLGDKVAKLMPPLVMGRDTPLWACLEETPKFADGYKQAGELRDLVALDPDVAKVVGVARGLEGLRRQDGIHAAAVVISADPLTEYLPIQRKPEPGGRPEDAPIVTQYEMHGVEDLGLLKMDFLGLRNLSVIERALDLIEEETGERPDIDNVDLEDAATFEMLQRADTIGVFQLEGGPMRNLVRSLAPTAFEDVAALVALYRPGPMAANMHNDYADRKNGRKPVLYQHPDMEEALGDTYGLCLTGDTIVHEARSGLPVRLDQIDPSSGFMVQGVDDDLNPTVKRVTHWVCNGNRETVRLSLANGMTLTGTPDHPVLTETGWKKLGELTATDHVAVTPRLLTPERTSECDPHRLRLLGYLLADGGLTNRSVEKYVPDLVFTLADDQVATFLAALWDCDGYVGERLSHYRTISARLASDVQRLLLRLGIESAVYSNEYRRPRDNQTMTAYQVTVYDGGRFSASIQPYLRGAAKGSVAMTAAPRGMSVDRRTLVDAVKAACPGAERPACDASGIPRWHSSAYAAPDHPRFSEQATVRIAASFNVTDVDRWLRCNWVKVRGVEPSGRQPVYDITVDGIHNFVANGIVAHNCIYQEQMMLLATKFAGYSLAEADNLRKAAGKKVRDIMAMEREKFEAGCETTGYGRVVGKMLFDIIEPFADYGFNRSHAFGYGFVSYQTAWLKAHYPAQYLASLLTSVKDDKDKTGVYLAECRAQNVEVLVPDINVAASDFTAVEVEDEEGSGKKRWVIPFGLSAIRNVGEALVDKLIAEREAGGPYADFYDFANRVDQMVLNKRTVESLIKAGAFDKMGHPRQGLCLVFEQIVDRTVARRRETDQGVMSLFGDLGSGDSVFDDARVPVPDQEFEKNARLAFEKEMLGLYLSDHPLKGVEAALARHTDTTISELRDQALRETSGIEAAIPTGERGGRRDGELRWVGGVITSLVRKYTKRGDQMATFTLEDLDSSIETWVFPKTMSDIGYLLADDAVVAVKGRLDLRDDQPKLICMEIKRPDLNPVGTEPLHLTIPIHALTDDRVDSLKQLLSEHPGPAPVLLHVGAKCIRLASEFSVDTTRGLLAELRILLGATCLGGA